MGLLDFLGLGSSLVGAAVDQKQWDDFIKRYDEQYGRTRDYARDSEASIKKSYSDLIDNATGDYAGKSRNLYNAYNANANDMLRRQREAGDSVLAAYDSNMRPVTDYAQKRYSDVMGILDTSGDQEKKDIQQQFNTYGSRALSNAVDRGLTGTTILPNLQVGVERERAGALGNLNTRLRDQKAGYASNLSADVLDVLGGVQSGRQATQSKYADLLESLFQDTSRGNFDLQRDREEGASDLGTQLRLGGLANETDLSNRMAGVLGNREQIAPQTSALTNIGTGLLNYRQGQQNARATERAGRRSMWGSLGGGALSAFGGTAGGIGTAGGFSKFFA